MIFRATPQQIGQILANAYNASTAVGMGQMHYRPGDIDPLIFRDLVYNQLSTEIYVDYCFGRMMKVFIEKAGDTYRTPTKNPDPEYQSWAKTYPTYESLILTVIEPKDIL